MFCGVFGFIRHFGFEYLGIYTVLLFCRCNNVDFCLWLVSFCYLLTCVVDYLWFRGILVCFHVCVCVVCMIRFVCFAGLFVYVVRLWFWVFTGLRSFVDGRWILGFDLVGFWCLVFCLLVCVFARFVI